MPISCFTSISCSTSISSSVSSSISFLSISVFFLRSLPNKAESVSVAFIFLLFWTATKMQPKIRRLTIRRTNKKKNKRNLDCYHKTNYFILIVIFILAYIILVYFFGQDFKIQRFYSQISTERRVCVCFT